MELNQRIKIKITDNNCIIQTEKNLPEAISNSVSFNISRSDDDEYLNSNIEISMQSIFLSDKKKSFESSNLQVTPRRSCKQSITKPELNKPTLKELSLSPNTLNEPITSGISTLKNTTASSSKIGSIPSILIKNTSNNNTITNNTSPFNSIGNTVSNNHSGSTSFIEKNLGVNNIILKPKNDPHIRKDVIDNFINKIVKQRSQSSRSGRIAGGRLSTSLSHKVLQCNPSVMSTTTVPKEKENIMVGSSSHKKLNSNSSCSSTYKNTIGKSVGKDDTKKIQFSPSSFTLLKRQTASATSLHKGSFSLVNFILGSCFIKNGTVKKTNCPNTCNSSRNHINLPLNKKLRTSPSPPKIIPIKTPIISKQITANNNNKNTNCNSNNNEDNKKKQVQTISNFSKYVKKSKGNNPLQSQLQLQLQLQPQPHSYQTNQPQPQKQLHLNNKKNNTSSLVTINTPSYKTNPTITHSHHHQKKYHTNILQKAQGDLN